VGRGNLKIPDIDRRPILKWILEKGDVVVWAEFIWLRIASSSRHL
jgi:hypothetical protein